MTGRRTKVVGALCSACAFGGFALAHAGSGKDVSDEAFDAFVAIVAMLVVCLPLWIAVLTYGLCTFRWRGNLAWIGWSIGTTFPLAMAALKGISAPPSAGRIWFVFVVVLAKTPLEFLFCRAERRSNERHASD